MTFSFSVPEFLSPRTRSAFSAGPRPVGRRSSAAAVIAASIAALLFTMVGQAPAAVVISFTEQGGDVVAAMSGTLNLTDLTSPGGGTQFGFVRPDSGFLTLGVSPASNSFTIYNGIQTPPNSGVFGTGGTTLTSSFTGDVFGIVSVPTPSLRVPVGYTSGAALSSTTTFTGTTLAGLGITPGDYVWSWGSGPNADTATLSASAVPEPTTWALLATAAGLGAFSTRRRIRAET